MTDPIYVSYSQIHDWLLCRHRWYLRYGLGIKPIEKPRPMDLGSAVHAGLAAFFRGDYAQSGIAEWESEAMKGIPIMDDSLSAHIEDIRSAAILIIDRTLDDFKTRGLWIASDDAGPIIEREIKQPVKGESSIGIHGIIDVTAYDPASKTYWIVDFKVRGTFQDDTAEDVNLQNAMYQMLGMSIGIPIVGTLTYQVSSKPPSKPKLNKDGQMSRARIATDWATYEKSLIDAGLDPDDYREEMQSKLDVEFVKPLKAYRSPEYVQNIWEFVVLPAARDIAWARKLIASNLTTDSHERVLNRNLSQRSCNGCGVRSLCLGKLRGYDALGILRAEYSYSERAVVGFPESAS